MAKHNVKLAKRYARALFESVPKSDLEVYEGALKELASIARADQSFRQALNNPAYPVAQRVDAACAIANVIIPSQSSFANFLGILAENVRINLLSDIAISFSDLLAQLKRLLTLEVTTAFPLPDEEKDAFLQRIQQEHGGLASIEWKVDPNVLGGIIVRAGDKLYDSSLRGSLTQIREQLAA